MSHIAYGDVSWERMAAAVEKVRQRLLRAASALEAAGIPYAVVGGNAVAAWVSRVDEAAVRNTQDVDILIRRQDLPAVIAAMSKAGFIHRHAAGIDMLLDGPEAKARDAVHLVLPRRRCVPSTYCLPPMLMRAKIDLLSPLALWERGRGEGFAFLSLESLVRMKLTSFRARTKCISSISWRSG